MSSRRLYGGLAAPSAVGRLHRLLVVSGIALTAAWLLSPGIQAPYHDGAIFAVIGEQWSRGYWPYMDAWDHKPPGVYAVAALAYLLPGPTWPAMLAASVAFVTGSALALRAVVGGSAAFVALIAIGAWPGSLGGGQTETLATLPAALAVWAATRDRWFVAGAMAGAALMFSFQLAAMLPFLLVLGWHRTPAMVLGAMVVVLPTASAFAMAGAIPEMIVALVDYSRVYLRSDRSGDLWTVGWVVPILIPFAALPLRRRVLGRIDLAAAAWIAFGAVLILAQGRLLSHYFVPLAIPMALLLDLRGWERRTVTAVAVVAALLVGWSVEHSAVHREVETRSIGQYIASVTEPGDTILVWGVEANVYLEAGRAPAGRYPYLMPLVTEGFTTPQMINDWVSALDADPPEIIVDSEAANPYWPDGDQFFKPPPPGAAGGRNLDILDPFRIWVAAHYAPAREIDGRVIYARQPLSVP